MTPLSVHVGVAAGLSDTVITVGASAQGLTGGLSLTLGLGEGVSFTGAEGDWLRCAQSGSTLRCSANPRDGGTWSGTLHTQWPAGGPDHLVATVSGRYRNGSGVTAEAGASWQQPVDGSTPPHELLGAGTFGGPEPDASPLPSPRDHRHAALSLHPAN
jgi:hypothetical protein